MENDITGAEAKALRKELGQSVYRGNHLAFCACLVLRCLHGLADIIVAYFVKMLVDAAASGSLTLLVQSFQLALLAVLVQLGASLGLRYVYAGFLRKAVWQYRSLAFEKLLRKRMGTFGRESGSDYLSALTNDVSSIEDSYLSRVFLLVEQFVLLVVTIVVFVTQSPILAVTAVLAAVPPLAAALASGNVMAQRQKAVSDEAGHFVATVKDLVSGFPVIKSFKAEQEAQSRFDQGNSSYENAKRRLRMTNRTVSMWGEVVSLASQFAVFAVSGWLCISGQRNVTAGTVVMTMQLMNYVAQPIATIPEILAGKISSGKLMDKLSLALADNAASEGTKNLPKKVSDSVCLDHVSFSYDGKEPVLKDISLTIPAHACYAVVGASGSGKSTLLSLLMGSLQGYDGSISYDGVNLSDASPESLYETVSLVEQSPFLFDATLKDNITMFREAASRDIERCVRLAGLDSLVDEKGLSYPCGEGGQNLSGGERQRAVIARSLLRGSSVLLLDEATSALDKVTEDHVTRSVLALDDTTRLVVTHHLDAPLLQKFDKIVVLRGGTVSELGSFDELMSKDTYFKALLTVSQA